MSSCKSATEIAMDQPQIDWQAVHVLAKLAALRAVKRQIQKEGRLRVSLIPAGRLDALAGLYLKAYPELFQEALASPLVQKSANTIKRRRLDPQRKFLNETHVQNGGHSDDSWLCPRKH
jgi:hypothetical protein